MYGRNGKNKVELEINNIKEFLKGLINIDWKRQINR